MFGNLGMGEIILVLVVLLLFFGAKRIPEIMGSFGKGIREFKKSTNEVERELTGSSAPRMDRVGGGESLREPVASSEDRPEPKRLI
jgi:sec-independent protein translocase protein TatA